jgi:hypothetical protein
MLVATLGSVSIARTGTEDMRISLVTSFTRGPLMDRAVFRLFGVSATGAMAF